MLSKTLKGYLRHKTIFGNKVALDVSRYINFCIFVKSTDFKTCDVTTDIATSWKLHLCLFLLNLKYYQNEIWSNTSVLHDKHF